MVGAGHGTEPTGRRTFDERAKHAILILQQFVLFQGATLRAALSPPYYLRDIVVQFDRIGVGTLPVIMLTGFFTGAVIALQTGITLDQFGARPAVGRILSASIVREVGPVFTTLMMAGRVGSGIAAELGSMTVTSQVYALRALGTDPMRKLVVPRVLAAVCMTPVLTVIYDTMGIIGGWLITVYRLRVAGSVYWTSVVDTLSIADVWMGLSKPLVLGYVIVSIACHLGLGTEGGTQGVGRATTQAVVAGAASVIAVDFLMTRVLITIFY